jgi:hypothetical protein
MWRNEQKLDNGAGKMAKLQKEDHADRLWSQKNPLEELIHDS